MPKYSKSWYIRITIMMVGVLIGMIYVSVMYCINAGTFAALLNLF